jgi:hypothetical protein
VCVVPYSFTPIHTHTHTHTQVTARVVDGYPSDDGAPNLDTREYTVSNSITNSAKVIIEVAGFKEIRNINNGSFELVRAVTWVCMCVCVAEVYLFKESML